MGLVGVMYNINTTVEQQIFVRRNFFANFGRFAKISCTLILTHTIESVKI